MIKTFDELDADTYRFFEFKHLPPPLREVSAPFNHMAGTLILELPACPQRSLALVRLLEAKDAAVRAKLST